MIYARRLVTNKLNINRNTFFNKECVLETGVHSASVIIDHNQLYKYSPLHIFAYNEIVD